MYVAQCLCFVTQNHNGKENANDTFANVTLLMGGKKIPEREKESECVSENAKEKLKKKKHEGRSKKSARKMCLMFREKKAVKKRKDGIFVGNFTIQAYRMML